MSRVDVTTLDSSDEVVPMGEKGRAELVEIRGKRIAAHAA